MLHVAGDRPKDDVVVWSNISGKQAVSAERFKILLNIQPLVRLVNHSNQIIKHADW